MVSASIGISTGRDLFRCAKSALQQAEKKLAKEPSVILLFTGLISDRSSNLTELKRIMSFIADKYPNTPMIGNSNGGVFDKSIYGLRGVAVILMSDIEAEAKMIKRFRLRNTRKTRIIVKECVNWQRDYGIGAGFLFFPPGVYFPKIFLRLFSNDIKINPVKLFNSRLIQRFKILSKVIGWFIRNFLGIGFPMDSTFELFVSLNSKGIVFSGNFASDPVGLNKPFQFCNYQIYTDALVYLCLGSKNAIFETQIDFGTEFKHIKEFSIDKFMDGGFISQISGYKAKDIYFKNLKIDPQIYYSLTKGTFYYNAYQSICIIDSKDKKPALYAISAPPALDYIILTAPNKVLEMLASGQKAFITSQSQNSILETKSKMLKDLDKKNVKLVLAFECANRAMLLSDRYSELIDIYRKELQEQPFTGIISGGEISSQNIPVFNFSSVLFIIKEKK
ncbi:MAG: FIST N-terminal domain-containing protein [Candidatus Hodarchaeales archaeon]